MTLVPLLLAIDQGTTSSRAIVFTADGQVQALAQKELHLYTPQNGWVEQDPEQIWTDTLACVREVLQKCPDVVAIGITNQRETTIIWDRETGQPIYRAIVWQDRRTADRCKALKEAGVEDVVNEKTGLLLDPYFSATKISWILDHVEGARHAADQGRLAFGTIDSFLLWRLTGGRIHATDATNASRTMLYNLQTGGWDDDLLRLFGVPRAILPHVKDNVANFGRTDFALLGRDLPIGGMAGDQQAAMIGQACFEVGMVKATYGTGCFALMNMGTEFRRSQNRMLTTLAYRLKGQATYAIEGSIFTAGAAIGWLRDNLGVIQTVDDSDDMARSVADTGGVYFVPAFTGLGAPYWDPDARGAILGMTRDTARAHIVRAALEAQAYQTHDLMAAMARDGGAVPRVLRVDGGLVQNKFMCQYLADILDCAIEVPQNTEATAFGAACLAGVLAGIYETWQDIGGQWRIASRFTPTMSPEQREERLSGWTKAVSCVTATRQVR